MSKIISRINSIKQLDYGLLTACLLPLFAIMPLLLHVGLPNSADGPIHLMRQVQFDQAWAEGNYYPRWGKDLAYGHGMPIFSYAPPALYFLTQFVHLMGLPLDAAMKAVVIFDFLLYGSGIFLLMRRLVGPYPALMAAAVHIYAPYRLREAFIQGNYGQFTGLACYAFILWGFHGLITDGRPRYLIAASLSLAGLLLSHNISAMIFAPLLAAYLIFLLLLYREVPFWRPLARTIAAGLLGLGLSAIFWLPAFGERHDIKLEGITQDFFDFRQNFLSLSELVSPPLRLDVTAINPEFPLSLGLVQIVAVIGGLMTLLIYLVSRLTPVWKGLKPSHDSLIWQAIFFVAATLTYLWLMIPPSTPLWETVPLLELTEFPWRMLGPAILCASVLAAFPFALLHDLWQRRWPGRLMTRLTLLYLIPLSLIIGCNLPYLYPSQFINWGNPTSKDVFQYEIDSGAIGTTSTGEFLPRTAPQHPEATTFWPDYAAGRIPQRIDPATLPPETTVETLYHRSESEGFRVNSQQPVDITLRMLYWPGWEIYLNGQPAPFSLTQNSGLVQLTLPAGQSIIHTQLGSTQLRTVGYWLTMLSAILLVGVVGYAAWPKKRDPTDFQNLSGLKNGVPPTTPIIMAAFLMLTFLLTRPLSSWWVWQSDVNRPEPADQLVQADFGQQIRLVGLDNLPAHLELEQTPLELEAVLYWRALHKLEQNYAIFLHLDAPDGQTVATVDEPNPEFIPTSKWPPGLYLRNRLPLEIPPHLPPIRYQLTAGVYDPESGQRLPLPTGETAYPLANLWLTQPPPPLPDAPLARFGPHVTLWVAKHQPDRLTLLWHTSQPLTPSLTIFIHVQDSAGNLMGQLDGPPFEGLYPLSHWLPGQIITDHRPLPHDLSDAGDSFAIGLYNLATEQRLPAVDAAGQPLLENRLIFLRER